MSNPKNLVIQVQPEIHAFIKEAFGTGDMSNVARDVLVKEAERRSGKTAPTVKAITRGFASQFADAAKAAGLNVEGFKRKCACESVGKTFTARDNEKLGYKPAPKAAPAPAAATAVTKAPAPAKAAPAKAAKAG